MTLTTGKFDFYASFEFHVSDLIQKVDNFVPFKLTPISKTSAQLYSGAYYHSDNPETPKVTYFVPFSICIIW